MTIKQSQRNLLCHIKLKKTTKKQMIKSQLDKEKLIFVRECENWLRNLCLGMPGRTFEQGQLQYL